MEDKMRAFLMKATRDADLRERFLAEPEKIAAEYDIKFKDDQLRRVKGLSEFIGALKEIVVDFPPKPGYWIDDVLQSWKVYEFEHLMNDYTSRYIIRYPQRYIFYPPPDYWRRRMGRRIR